MTNNERKECISALRQLVAMCDFVDQYGDCIDADPYFNAVETAIESLNGTRWIPVSERLPDAEYGESDSVLCCTESGLMYILYWNGGNWCVPTGEPYQWINYETGWHDKVIAWMPLPEPYREDGEA